MSKFFFVAAAAMSLTGCSLIDPLFGTEEGTVEAVNRERGCSVTFSLKGQEKTFISVAETPYKENRCMRLRPGMTVPIVSDPIYGDYPYVLFEETGG